MLQDVVQSYSQAGVDSEASLHKVHGLLTDLQMGAGGQLTSEYLTIRCEGDVTTEHVIQQHPQAPGGQALRSVLPISHPLRRRVDTGASKLCVDSLLSLLCLL